MMTSKQDVMKVAGSLQVCVGQDAGVKAAIQAVYYIFKILLKTHLTQKLGKLRYIISHSYVLIYLPI